MPIRHEGYRRRAEEAEREYRARSIQSEITPIPVSTTAAAATTTASTNQLVNGPAVFTLPSTDPSSLTAEAFQLITSKVASVHINKEPTDNL
jgi:hypothetical protein